MRGAGGARQRSRFVEESLKIATFRFFCFFDFLRFVEENLKIATFRLSML